MIKNGLIVGLAILAIFLFLFKSPTKVITNTKVDTIITHQTFTKYTKGDKIPFKILDTIHTSTHDTVKIIQEFNEFIVYRDSINQDSNLFVIQDTVHQNKIIGRSFDAKLQKKTIVITNTIQPKYKAGLYFGFRSDLSHDYSKVNHNISLSLKTRHKGLYTVGYGMAGYSVGYSFKF